ncbi:uncharacterized protein LOC119080505 [Bradysia coprophila]|uniref:uncharacterized protein LOC119080505 n=1 Tax=Bradysia coprophila TaxID=38358 RepID=UPI00187D7F90|nr:uncharacterized protein LOC119080505 [Bradysia coprophila]
MRFFCLILCLVQFQVQASDWFNRTVRVDLIVNSNGRAYDSQYDSLELSEDLLSSVIATNGEYPWNIYTIAWGDVAPGSRHGQMCLSTIISNNFFLTDFFCVGLHLNPVANSIETFFGYAPMLSPLFPTNFVRHYWYIEPSPEDSPRIVLSRFHEAVTFNPNIQPIRLPSSENFSYEAWSSHLLGHRSGPGNVWAHLQSTHASILNNSLCNFHGIIHDHEICATDGGERFDGGSPGGAWIVYEYTAGFEFIPVVIGIERFLNQTLSFAAASRVSYFVEWIETLQRDN